MPYSSELDFWKSKFENSSSTNWIFNLQKSISKMIFAGYTGSKSPVQNRLKIQFVKHDFSKLIFRYEVLILNSLPLLFKWWRGIKPNKCSDDTVLLCETSVR